MGSKSHGTWAQFHEDIHDHPKTVAIAAALVKLGVPEAWSADVAVAQLHRLACWAIRDGNDGRVGHLTATRFAMILRWPRGGAERLLAAWNASGFFDDAGTPTARIHDFGDYFWHILRKRVPGARPAPDSDLSEAESGAHPAPNRRPTGAEPAPNRQPKGARPAPKGGSHARPRAHDPEFRNTGTTPPTPLVASAAPEDKGGGEPLPEPSRTAANAPQAAAEGTDTPSLIAAAWNAARARRGLPPVSAADLGPALDVLAKAAPGDPVGQAALAAAYVGLDDDWLAERGWAPWALRNRVDALLVARRSRTVTPPVHASEAIVLPRVPGATAAELRPYARPASQPFTAAEEEEIAERIRGSRAPAAPSTPRWRPAVAEGAAP